jgi:3-carboxy-cis,cis-muconate cycloisomerase
MSHHLVGALATTGALAAAFSDRAVVQAMLDVEIAIARAQAAAGVIPDAAARAIAAADASRFDAEAIAREARASATPAIPFVRALTALVRECDPSSAGYVHWGATSQDIADTALVLVLREAFRLLDADQARIVDALVRLSDAHAGTIMLGRTLLQPAPPVTFGLVAAGWLAALRRGWDRVVRDREAALVLQLGGASGTLAAFGDAADGIVRGTARDLGLDAPPPWHTHRDRLAALFASLGVYVGSLGKLARDVSLLMQAEVAEVSEPGGGSSTMPHKRNPSGSAIVLAAAARTPGLVAAYLTGMVQEHQRALGGWHAEWPIAADLVQTTGSALAAAAEIAEGLTVDAGAMRDDIARTRGMVFAERAMLLLARHVGRDIAHGIVQDAVRRGEQSGQTLRQALEADPRAAVLTAGELESLDRADAYLGISETIRQRLRGR